MVHSNNAPHDTSGQWTPTKAFMLNHIRDVNFPATILVLYIIFSLVTKGSIADSTSRNILLGIGALALFGLYVYTHMWRDENRIKMFYNGDFDTLGVKADNVLLIFGISYIVFVLAFWWIAKKMKSSGQDMNEKQKRTINCIYFLLVWAVVIGIHNFWAFFASDKVES